jgi:hypothetical protein
MRNIDTRDLKMEGVEPSQLHVQPGNGQNGQSHGP